MHRATTGMPFAVATNGRTARALGKLRDPALAGQIDVLVGYDQAAGKPAPDVHAEAARRLGVDPTACLAFEDSDLACARRWQRG